MRKSLFVALGALVLPMMMMAQQGKAEEKAPTTRTLKVKLNYTGSGTVDAKHHIIVFLFDSPDFTSGAVPPFSTQHATAKNESVTINGIEVSPVYVVVAYDPSGEYDGQSGPPPAGSSVSMYTKNPPAPEPVKIEPGKTVEIDLAFDDSNKMPG